MFGFNAFEIYDVIFEIYIENKLIKKQSIQAPKEILIANFIQTTNQISRDSRPMKILMSRPEIIWDNFENKEKIITNEVSFINNAMIAWEETNKGEKQ